MHSNLKKGLFLVTFLGMTVSPGISVMAADGDTTEAVQVAVSREMQRDW